MLRTIRAFIWMRWRVSRNGFKSRQRDSLEQISRALATLAPMFLILMLVAFYDPSTTTTVVVLGCTTWMAAARLVRGEILSARERDFVHAARAGGVDPLRLGFVHLLPAATVPLLVQGTLRVGDTILLEASLSFLGLGVQPPLASWGNLIADGKDALVLGAWWISTLPGLAIAATVVALNVVGEAARDRIVHAP